jgi:hypothetical protein
MKCQQKWIAAAVMLGVIFTQIVTAAYACPRLLSPSGGAGVLKSTKTQSLPPCCLELIKKLRGNANCCEACCTSGQQIDTCDDAPVAAVAPQPALTIRVAEAATVRAKGAGSVPAPNAIPPPLLRFSRLLI